MWIWCLKFFPAKERALPTLSHELSGRLIEFAEAQPLFFVATAAPSGRVNLSPKGLNTLRILGPNRVVWLSLSGSGNETAAHLLEDPRMTLMFCAFDGDALILRVYGKARAVHPRDTDWDELSSLFGPFPGARQIYDLSVDLVQTSCGTGVPQMHYQRERGDEELLPFYQELGETGVKTYWSKKNVRSIDGRPTGIFDD